MSKNKHHFQWAVVGAGPAGVSAVGMLLDAGISATDIIWFDPHFSAGDLGNYWQYVSSNTKAQTFRDYFEAVEAFQYAKRPHLFVLDQLSPEDHCLLGVVAEPLQWVTTQLRQNLNAIEDTVIALTTVHGYWQITTKNNQQFSAEKVILATGAEPKTLDHLAVEQIDLKTALNPKKLAALCSQNETIAVFGSSHSAMIIIRQLIELGVKQVVNFYLEPIRYAIFLENWILYDNTGLKADTAAWVHQNITKNCLPNIKRYRASAENIDKYLPACNKAICAIGFKPRNINITGVNSSHYDKHTGIIAPGLFGLGIAFPQVITTPLGHQEYDVGLWKFVQGLKRVMPIWLEYSL